MSNTEIFIIQNNLSILQSNPSKLTRLNKFLQDNWGSKTFYIQRIEPAIKDRIQHIPIIPWHNKGFPHS